MTCPCKSSHLYINCCKPFHDYQALPRIPEELMRSRYSAYALSNIDYIIDTTDKDGPQYNQNIAVWKKSLLHFSQTTAFQNLTILENASISETEATVTFLATLQSLAAEDMSFTEKSLFKKKKGKWYYHSRLPFSSEL